MRKLYKFFEYGYLLIALFLLIEAFLKWSSKPQKAYFYLGFSVVAIFMYFFKKKFRKKIEKSDKKSQ